MSFNASCLCGSVRFSTKARPVYSAYCHCSECRKFSGSGHSAFIGVSFDQLNFNPGSEQYLGTYPKTQKTTMVFCNRCGSSLMAHKLGSGMAHVRLGCIDTPVPLMPMAHLHCSSAALWETLPDDNLPRLDTVPRVEGASSLTSRPGPRPVSDGEPAP